MRRKNCRCVDAAEEDTENGTAAAGAPLTGERCLAMDFVFDRVAGGRAIKNLTVVDDATHEAVAVVPEFNISGRRLVRILEEICTRRGYPKVHSHRQWRRILQSQCWTGRTRSTL